MSFSSDSVELFLAVVEAGSFSAAARALGKVPSAVSMGIANLEAELGYPLFDRSHREPVPTDLALALIPHARLMAEQLKQLQVHALQLSRGLESKLSIGVGVDINTRRLLAAIGEIGEAFPLLEIEVLTAPQDDVLQLLHLGRVQVCVVFAGLRVNVLERFQFVDSEQLIACISPQHPQAGGEPFLEDLVRVRQILVAGRDIPLSDRRPLVGQSYWRTDSLGMALDMVEAGLGWGNFPLSAVAPLLEAGRLRRLNFKNIENGLAMVVNAVWLKNQPLHKGASALVQALADAAR
ncbi:LysR family transcriptional regulator [Pseudomonas sp. NS1(2017)]|jgi:DNA-binding transcriptional LysR family regulator|uniref:LysR family transcriptional regulator n=1 Tax=Pseudomonas reactans TaxID=117680 RepID=A0ABX2QY51_9PSED|nr:MULTISPECIES: LysR family transcriptional regulator [Pseudomonas]ASV40320.1 LysR family transcriptional regulator [Pseudomonas sp. NS1(2017)]NWA36302.1 LysR family transcriptional regulator [Pseudomonas reactans]NWD95450.1 LysR family transcriptional regulator [Pseudomonas reactans]NWF17556.1 LysR family transcriptional regulator [Pseudomonas reactans]